ncbi:MAG: DinB family protein [Rhodothermia bacterium]|nr:DinB family protein [Rhodothermia bacterium]
MSKRFTIKPSSHEYNDFYHGYVSLVPDGDVIGFLTTQMASTAYLFRGVPKDRAGHRYKAGKWSIKQVAGHLCDSERLFSGRAMQFARNEPAELPGMDQDVYVDAARFDQRTLVDISDELFYLRKSNILLFSSFSDEELDRGGVASGWPVTVRALMYIVGGHQEHHVRFLRANYLASAEADPA